MENETTSLKDLYKLLQKCTVDSIASRTSELHRAAVTGDVPALRKALEESPSDIDLEDDNHRTPLVCAARGGHTEIVEMLLEYGAKVNHPTNSPLLEVKNVEIAKFLIEKGAEINQRDRLGNTPLHRKIQINDMELINFLLEHGTDPNIKTNSGNTVFHELCSSQNENIFAITEKLLEVGADINLTRKDGKTCLHLACEGTGTSNIISVLVRNGARLDLKDRKGYCPIHYLIDTFPVYNSEDEQELSKLLEALLPDKTCANLKTATYASALHVSAANCYPIVAKQLLQKGSEVNCVNGLGKTALHLASSSSRRNPETVRVLIAQGADLNANDFWGSTPLHDAAASGNADVMKILLDKGANPIVVDENGATALHIASTNSSVCLEILLKHGCDVNALDFFKSSPLHFAAWADNVKSAAVLIENGSNPELKDSNGSTAKDIAVLVGSGVTQVIDSDCATTSGKVFTRYGGILVSEDEFNALMADEKHFVKLGCDLPAFCSRLLNEPGVGQVLFENEARQVHDAVEEMVENLVKGLTEFDPRFKCTLLRAGSASEGTKIKFPNEFDFMFCLEEFSDVTYSEFEDVDSKNVYRTEILTKEDAHSSKDAFEHADPSENILVISDYVTMKLKDTEKAKEFSDFTDMEETLIPCWLMYYVMTQTFNKILMHPSFPKHPNLILKEVSVEPKLSLEWRGCAYKRMDIEVDLVPAIRLPHWPKKTRTNSILLTPDILDICALVVPKLVSDIGPGNLWRCSLSLQESAIFRKLKPRIRNSYTTAKAMLNSAVVCPVGTYNNMNKFLASFLKNSDVHKGENIVEHLSSDEAIPSYVLKMMFFFALESKAEAESIESVYTIFNNEDLLLVKENVPQSCIYGPATERNICSTSPDVDIPLVKEIYERCSKTFDENCVQSFFNPMQNVFNKDARHVGMSRLYVKFVNKLLNC